MIGAGMRISMDGARKSVARAYNELRRTCAIRASLGSKELIMEDDWTDLRNFIALLLSIYSDDCDDDLNDLSGEITLFGCEEDSDAD